MGLLELVEEYKATSRWSPGCDGVEATPATLHTRLSSQPGAVCSAVDSVKTVTSPPKRMRPTLSFPSLYLPQIVSFFAHKKMRELLITTLS